MTQYRGYCLSHKTLVDMIDVTVNVRGNRRMAQGKCTLCASPVNRILTKGN